MVAKIRLFKRCVGTCLFTVLLLLIDGSAHAIPVVVANAPQSNLGLTLRAIENAQHQILINAYEFSSGPIGQALKDKINRGVQVVILKEGQPVGGMTQDEKQLASTLVSAMHHFGNDRFFLMTAPSRSQRRYVYDHAKYMVFDAQAVLVGSENYAPTGQPEPPAKGNRGWEVLVNDPRLAQTFTQVFKGDTDMSHGDIQDITHAALEDSGFPLTQDDPNGSGIPMNADAVDPIFSPQTSLQGILALIRSAQRTIDVEQMSMPMIWQTQNSPIIEALFEAAARGVHVRVILNDDAESFHRKPPNNWDIARALNQQAQGKHVTLAAKVANLRKMGVSYIHNKGMLVDGDRTLISSINFTQNAVMNNRESAVVVRSAQVFAYYENLFNFDWAQ